MDYFKMDFDTKKCIITVRYYNVTYYRTLLESLSELLTLKIRKRVRIVLDFSEVKSFLINYCQITKFRKSLKAFLNVKASRIAIINAPKASWGDIGCSPTPHIENDLLIFDLHGFRANQKSEAYRWVQ